MISDFDLTKLRSLLQDFHTLTHIRITVFNDHLQELISWPEHLPSFCRMIRSHPDGLARCQSCDRDACHMALHRQDTCIYRCHAGLTEAVSPIYLGDMVIGYLLFGHILAQPDRESLQSILETASRRYELAPDRLYDCCRQLPVCSADYIAAASNLLRAVASYLCMERMILLRQNDLPIKLDRYIQEHLHEPLSARCLCDHLKIGKTRLYELSRQSYGCGIARHIRSLRIDRAKSLLLEQPDLPVAKIAELCGFQDYNYFITVFKKQTKTTPSRFRSAEAEKFSSGPVPP